MCERADQFEVVPQFAREKSCTTSRRAGTRCTSSMNTVRASGGTAKSSRSSRSGYPTKSRNTRGLARFSEISGAVEPRRVDFPTCLGPSTITLRSLESRTLASILWYIWVN